MITMEDKELIGKTVLCIPNKGSARGHSYCGELIALKTAEEAQAPWDIAVVLLSGATTETHWRLDEVQTP